MTLTELRDAEATARRALHAARLTGNRFRIIPAANVWRALHERVEAVERAEGLRKARTA